MNDNYIGTEHLLLGLIREGNGLAGRILASVGAELEAVRREVIARPSANRRTEAAPPASGKGSSLLEAVRARFGFAKLKSGPTEEIETENAAIWERSTPRARAIITRAQNDATDRGATGIAAEHLVLALLDDPECRGMRAIVALGPSLPRLRRAAEALAETEAAEEIPSPMPFAVSGQNAITMAHLASIAMGNPFLGTEHLALILFGGAVGEVADPEALQPERVREAIARSQAEE